MKKEKGSGGRKGGEEKRGERETSDKKGKKGEGNIGTKKWWLWRK